MAQKVSRDCELFGKYAIAIIDLSAIRHHYTATLRNLDSTLFFYFWTPHFSVWTPHFDWTPRLTSTSKRQRVL